MGGWREHRLGLLVGLFALIAAAPGVLSVAGVRNGWILAGVTALAAVSAGSAVVWQDRYKRIAQRRDDVSLDTEQGCLVLHSGKLPKVREVANPVALGIHPSAATSRDGPPDAIAAIPEYVARDADAVLRAQLARRGFILLVGDSTAGKSRAAYEAMARSVPEHLLIVPAHRDAIGVAVTRAVAVKRCVLWLDDLERFLGVGGLTRTQVARLLSGSDHHRIILATLRGVEERRFTERSDAEDDIAKTVAVSARETLAQVTWRLRLERKFSTAERERAQALAWDSRIAEALLHADEYGLGEYLACGPELQRDLDNAWEPGANPRGAALVASAVEVRRAGYVDPAPKPLLEQLHELALEQRGGDRLRPETLDDAWDWATRRRRATVALLQPASNGTSFAVFDYIADEIQRQVPDLPSDEVISTVLSYADAANAGNIGDLTSLRGAYPLARMAYRRAYELQRADNGEEHPNTLISRDNHAQMLWELGHFAASEAEHRAVLEIQRRVLGEEHPHTLTSRGHHALVVWDLGRLDEAEAELLAVLEIRRRLWGEEHPDTLHVRGERAGVLRELGRFAESEAEHRAVHEVFRRILGEEHPVTLINRNGLALVLWESGQQAKAETEQRDVLGIRRRVLGAEHPDTLVSRNNLALVLRDTGRLAEAMAEHRAVLTIRRRILGEEHPATLLSRDNLALVLCDLGRSVEAEAEHRAVLQIRSRILGEKHPDTLISRDNHAVALRELERLEEAIAEHQAVLAIRRQTLGETHPHTQTSRNNLATVLAKKETPTDIKPES